MSGVYDLDDLHKVLREIADKLGDIDSKLDDLCEREDVSRKLDSLMRGGTDLSDLTRALEGIESNTRRSWSDT